MGMWRRLVAAVGVPALAAATLPSAIEKDDECQDETCALGALQLTGQKKVSEFVEAEEADAFEAMDFQQEAAAMIRDSEASGMPRFYPLDHGWHKVASSPGDRVGFTRASLRSCEYFCANTDGCHSFESCPKTRACVLRSQALSGTEPWVRSTYCQTWYRKEPGFSPTGGKPVVYKQCEKGSVPEGGKCVKANGPASMTFYQYSAQSKYDPDRKWENMDMASLGGVLFYLHNEVVGNDGEQLVDGKRTTKFAIDRIVRFKVTVHNTDALWKQFRSQFGQFIQFDYGQATFGMPNHVKKCNDIWTKFGFEVGCQPVPEGTSGYEGGYWTSYPGTCPSMPFTDDSPQGGAKKTAACKAQWQGGNCPEPDGTPDCTWHVEPAGYVMLDELTGVNAEQVLNAGGHLYDEILDAGTGGANNFWARKKDKQACKSRENQLLTLFARKFPDFDAGLPDPPCDFWR